MYHVILSENLMKATKRCKNQLKTQILLFGSINISVCNEMKVEITK